MISCIIYEDNEQMQTLYQEVAESFFKAKNQTVTFYIYQQYEQDLETKICNIPEKKLFILDIEVPGKSGLDLARIIRSSGDWNSPLIVVTGYEHLKSTGFTSKMLMLDFISKKENIKEHLKESLEVADSIIHTRDSYTFQYNGELYHVDYQDILYFEKDLNDNYTFLFTKQTSYKIKESIQQIGKVLEKNQHFLKTHRSCIVNIDNIDYLDIKNNTLHLGNYSIDLLTKENRDFLRKQLKNSQIVK